MEHPEHIEHLKRLTSLNHMFTLLHRRNLDQPMQSLDVVSHSVVINIELCRYGLARIPVEERVCIHRNEVEDESHVLMHCPLYDDIRNQFILDVNNINPSFQDLSLQERFIQLMSNPIIILSCSIKGHLLYFLNQRRFVV